MNYYYTFIKEDEFITVSGSGDDPHDLDDISWVTSPGAAGVLKQMDDISCVYTPAVGFVGVDDYPNNIYVQIGKFGNIYKDGWRFKGTNLPELDIVKSELLEKAKSKKRVFVRASKERKAHYRWQDVGREEIDVKEINHLWELPLNQLQRLCKGDKQYLKECYIEDRGYNTYDTHWRLEYLCGLMNERMKANTDPQLMFFSDTYSKHEQAVATALGNHEPVPLHVLKDYSDLAYSYDIDISDEALATAEPATKYKRLCEMPKDEYDRQVALARKDYNRDPNKVTDAMLRDQYPAELEDVKKAAKFRKKLFNNLPENLKSGFTPETMNAKLHKEVIKSARFNEFDIPTEVKAEYPTMFTEMPFNYSPTGDEKVDAEVNSVLRELRGQCGNQLSYIPNAINALINPSDSPARIEYDMTWGEKRLAEAAMDDVSQLLNQDLKDRINQYSGEPVKMTIDKSKVRASGGKAIKLGLYDINVFNETYNLDTIAHEYGHSIEHMVPEIRDLSLKFIEGRTGNDPLVALKDIYPGSGYAAWETVIVDNFVNPYIGKNYNGKSTEVLSMGMGYLTKASAMMNLYNEDPEYLGYILAVLSGRALVDNVAVNVELSPEQVAGVAKALNDKGALNLVKGEKTVPVKGHKSGKGYVKPHRRKVKTAAEADTEIDAKLAALRDYKEAAMRTEDWLKDHPEQKKLATVIDNFSVSEYEDINKYLRGDTPKKMTNEEINDSIKSISAFLNEAPKFSGVVFRGMGFDPNVSKDKVIYDNFINDIENNDTVILPSFTSTTCEMEIAMNFSGEGTPKYASRIILEIKSKNGVALNGAAAFPKEQEILFDKGTEFKIIDVKDMGGLKHIRLEEL